MLTQAEQLRDQWMQAGLTRKDLDQDPFKQFQQWYQQAIESGIPEPNAMSLATVSSHNQPWLRTVLLKFYDTQGFVFFTNYGSHKAQQIALNNKIAMLFPWVALGRQIHIRGHAERIPTSESLSYFVSRPRGSQLGAWASSQSKVINSRSLLMAKFEEMKEKFAHGEVPLPSFWGGYRVIPQSFEFWQSRTSRMHDRFIYTLNNNNDWGIERHAP